MTMTDTPTPEAPEAPPEGEPTPTDTPPEGDSENDEANANGGPTWQHTRFTQSYPDSGLPD